MLTFYLLLLSFLSLSTLCLLVLNNKITKDVKISQENVSGEGLFAILLISNVFLLFIWGKITIFYYIFEFIILIAIIRFTPYELSQKWEITSTKYLDIVIGVTIFYPKSVFVLTCLSYIIFGL